MLLMGTKNILRLVEISSKLFPFELVPDISLANNFPQKKNPDKPPEKKAAKVDLSPLFLSRELPMPNREAVSCLEHLSNGNIDYPLQHLTLI